MRSSNIKSRNRHSRRNKKYKLLLDEGLPNPQNYPQLNNFHDLKHLTHDLRFSGIKDSVVYELANKFGRLVVVFNTKDFKPLISPGKSSVISLSTNLTNKEADKKISKALRELSSSQAKGCLISISKSGINIKIPQRDYEDK